MYGRSGCITMLSAFVESACVIRKRIRRNEIVSYSPYRPHFRCQMNRNSVLLILFERTNYNYSSVCLNLSLEFLVARPVDVQLTLSRS